MKREVRGTIAPPLFPSSQLDEKLSLIVLIHLSLKCLAVGVGLCQKQYQIFIATPYSILGCVKDHNMHVCVNITNEHYQLVEVTSGATFQGPWFTDEFFILCILSYFSQSVVDADFLSCRVQSASKAHPGKIVSLELCPINHNLVLIGYEKGIIVLWDFDSGLPTKNFPVSVQDCQQVTGIFKYNINRSF